MTENTEPVDADSTLGEWMAHPVGARVVAGLAAQGNIGEDALRLARNVPLSRFLGAGGPLPEGMLDGLVATANGGTPPDHRTVPRSTWTEVVTTGRFGGKTVIVTGAASGIGRAVASRVAREGGRVIAVDLSLDRLQVVADSLPDAAVVPVAGDITSASDITRIIEAAGRRIDGLANVAGLLDDFSPIHEVSDAVLERVFDVNVFGLIKLTRAVIPQMMERRRGSIVNIASEAALRGSSAGLAYTASKNAVVGVTKSTAYMYEPYGIRVNAVAPGGTLTGMRPGRTNEFGQARLDEHIADAPLALPEALAASITFLLSDDGVNITGAVLPSDGGESVY